MKKIALVVFISIVICLSSCINAQNTNSEKQTKNSEVTDFQEDIEEIQKLIHQVLSWSVSKETIDLLPVLTDRKDSVYSGFDLNILNANIMKLKETHFFTKEFTENYNQIILALDQKLRSREFEEWFVGTLPTFKFANGISPWCLCQSYSSVGFHDIEVIRLDNKSGELVWKWANTMSWKDFRFKVAKENNKWKISYLEGFDYKESIKRDGEI